MLNVRNHLSRNILGRFSEAKDNDTCTKNGSTNTLYSALIFCTCMLSDKMHTCNVKEYTYPYPRGLRNGKLYG